MQVGNRLYIVNVLLIFILIISHVDADALVDLEIWGNGNKIQLTPAFATDTLTGYLATVNSSVTSLRIRATKKVGASSTTVAKTGDNTPVDLPSGTFVGYSNEFPLLNGTNTLNVSDTADGDYIIKIIRRYVTALTITDQNDNDIILSPSFTGGTTGYTATVQSSATSVKVTATFVSGSATAYTGTNTPQDLSSGTAVGHTTHLSLVLGDNTLTVTHSADGNYSIKITRDPDVTAVAITDQAGHEITLSPSFVGGTLTGYRAITLATATSLKVTATFASGTALAKTGNASAQQLTTATELNDAINLALNVGNNTLTIISDRDGHYIVTITVRPQISVALSPIIAKEGDNIIATYTGHEPGIEIWLCYRSDTAGNGDPGPIMCGAAGTASTIAAAVSGAVSGDVACTANATDGSDVSLTWTEATETHIRIRACTSNNDTVQADNPLVVLELEPKCYTKDEAEWRILGCNVTNPNATQVSGLGIINPAIGYQSCDVTCPTDGQAFNVTVVENKCIAKEDEAAWASLGCVVSGKQNGTNITSLGNQNAFSGYQNCEITCPTHNGEFAVHAVPSPGVLFVIEETNIGMNTNGGSIVTLMIEPTNFPDLPRDENYTVSYGPLTNLFMYSNVLCIRESVYNKSCLSEETKPGIQRTNLFWRLNFFPNASLYPNQTFLSNNSIAYRKPNIFEVSYSARNMNTEGGTIIVLRGTDFGGNSSNTAVYYGVPSQYFYKAEFIASQKNGTEIFVKSIPAEGGGQALRDGMGWFVNTVDQNSTWFNVNVTSYHPPIIKSVSLGNYVNFLNTSGGTQIIVSGSNFGKVSDSSISLTYGQFNTSHDTLSTPLYNGNSCEVNIGHTQIICIASAGAGKDLAWRVSLGTQKSLIYKSSVRYEKPVILGISIFEGASQMDYLRTDGKSSLKITGTSFGPSATPCSVSHMSVSGERILSNCVVDLDSLITCSFSGVGTGRNHIFYVEIAKQVGVWENNYVGYKSPSITDVKNIDHLDSHNLKKISIIGNDFGLPYGHLRVTYGPATGLEYSARNCMVVTNHTNVICDSVSPAYKNGNGRAVGMKFQIVVDGLASSFKNIKSAKYTKDAFTGFDYKDGLAIGFKTFDAINNVLYVLGQNIQDFEVTSLYTYKNGIFNISKGINQTIPNGITTILYYHRNQTLLCTKYHAGKTMIGKLEFDIEWVFVPYFDLYCPDMDYGCRVKYGVGAIDESRNLYYVVIRHDYEGDIVVQVDLHSGNSSVAYETDSNRFEIGEISVLYDIKTMESSLNLISRYHFNTDPAEWNSITINMTSKNPTKNNIFNDSHFRRKSLLNFDLNASSNIYMASSTYTYSGQNINMKDGNLMHLYDLGREEYDVAIPVVGGINTFDLESSYSTIMSGTLVNAKVPRLKILFPDAKTGWESFRMFIFSDKPVRLYVLLVQKKRKDRGIYPTMEEVFTGNYIPLPAAVGENVAVRHYVLDIPVPLSQETLVVGADQIIPDTTDYDIYYIAHEGSFGTTKINHVNASTVSTPPATKAEYPKIADVTVNSFVYQMRFSDRKGSVYYVVTDEFNLCDETMLADTSDSTKDLRDRLKDCAATGDNFGYGEFKVENRETPIEIDEARGEFSGFVEVKDLPPYRSYYVFAVGISFGQTAQFSYMKTRIDLVGFTVLSQRPIINEGDVNPLEIYVELSKRPHLNEQVFFSCKIDDPTGNVIYRNLPSKEMGSLGYENFDEFLKVGYVTGVSDTRNDEDPYEDFKIICSNTANDGEESIYKLALNIELKLKVKNVIWPSWSNAYVYEKNDDKFFEFPEHKHAMRTSGEDTFKLAQLDKDWTGEIFLDGLNATLGGIAMKVNVLENKRAVSMVLPPYSILCSGGCEDENGYQNLSIKNPHNNNGSTGGTTFTTKVYYFEECDDKDFETAASICFDPKQSSEKCAWGSGSKCEKCPENSICPGGARAWPLEGYWSPNEFGKEIFRCRTPSYQRCKGYNITSGRAECKEGYDSDTEFCDQCALDYYETIDGKCHPCEELNNFWNAVLLPLLNAMLFCFLVFLVVTSLVYITTVIAGSTILSAFEMTMRFLFESLLAAQLIAVAAMPVNAEYFTWLKNIFQGLYVSLFDFRGQVYSQCVGRLNYTQFLFESTGMLFVLFVLVLSALMTVKPIKKLLLSWPLCKKNSCNELTYGYTQQGLLSFLQLSYGAVAVNAFDLVNCKVVLGKYRLTRRPSVICYEGPHLQAASVSLIMLILFTFGFPIVSYLLVKSVLAGQKNHRHPSLSIYSFWTRSDLKQGYYFFREIRQIIIACLAGSAAFFTGNESRSGALGINIVVLITFIVLILYMRPYKKSGGWIVSSLISACLLSILVSMLSFVAWLTFDNRVIELPELYNSLEWITLFSFIWFFAFNWWRFQTHVLSFRKSMSRTLGIRSHPQHRWAHHVHNILQESKKEGGERRSGKKVNNGKKGRKSNKILPTQPILSKPEPAYEQKVPNYSRKNRRNVTMVVPTRIGNVVRINLAENDGHELPASWCFSHKKLHQHSLLRRTMSWWYSLQFLLQIFVLIITLSMPYINVPSSVEEVKNNVDSRRRVLSTETNGTTTSNLLENNKYYITAREALENATFQSLLLAKSIISALVLFIAVSHSRKRRGILHICTKYCHLFFQLIFICITIGSIYGFLMLKNDAVPRYIAMCCESFTLLFSIVSKCHERQLRKRAARVRPIGMATEGDNRMTAVYPVTSDRRGMSVKKKNKIVAKEKKGRKGLFSFSSDKDGRSMTKVVPQSTVEGRHVFEEHVFDEEDLLSHVQNTANIECILLLKPAERLVKELEMMRHEEERHNMAVEDIRALRIRDEPKRILELERLRREEARQQMYETEMAQIAVEEEQNRRREIKSMRMQEAQERMIIEDKRSRLENDLFDGWSKVQKDREIMELDQMRQEENQRRVYLEEIRHLWLLDCEAHMDELAREQQFANIYLMRREEEQQRMFEIEHEQRTISNLIVMHNELPMMRREEACQRMIAAEDYRRKYLEDHQLAASQMSAIRVLQEKLDSEDVEQIQEELKKVHKVFKVSGGLQRLVKRCEEFVQTEIKNIKDELIEAMNDFENPNHLDRLEVAISKAWHLLHPAEQKLLDEATAIEKELEHLRDITKQVENLDQTTIAEIKSFKKPNEQIVSVIVALFILLGHQPEELDTWKKCTAALSKTGEQSVKRRIMKHNLVDVTKKQIKLVKKLVKSVEITKIQSISSTAATFFGWVMGVVAEYKLLGTKSRAQSRASLGAMSTTKKKKKKKKKKVETLDATTDGELEDISKKSESRIALKTEIDDNDFDAKSTKSIKSIKSNGRKTPTSKKKKKKKRGSSSKKKKK